MVHAKSGAKPLSIAIEELEEGQLKIMAENAEEADALQAETEEAAEASFRAKRKHRLVSR